MPESELYVRFGWLIILVFGISFFPLWLNNMLFYLVLLAGVIDLLYVLVFRTFITPSAIEAIFLTNSKESLEFIKSYFSLTNFVIVAFYILISQMAWLYSPIFLNENLGSVFTGIVIFLSVVIFYKIAFKANYKGVLPGVIGMIPTYLKDKKLTDALIDKRGKLATGLDENKIKLASTLDSLTTLVVIGESSSRRHQQLYGYGRETTPHQNSFADELIILNNMISNFSQTNPSLSNILTEAEQDSNLSADSALSIIDIANKAGIETWWISNQESNKSTPNAIAKCANHCYFLQVENALKKYDADLLPQIEKAVSSNAKHKIIFVHLSGSHLQYKERYPVEFDFFKDSSNIKPYTKKISKKIKTTINEYDNAVRYTDHVLDKIRQSLKNSVAPSVMIYLSDHGEEVFDTRNFKGHEPSNFSKPMFEIPFWVWASKDYKKVHQGKLQNLQSKQNSPLELEDLFHFVLDISTVESDYSNIEKSWGCKKYKLKPRIVYGKDFDRFFT